MNITYSNNTNRTSFGEFKTPPKCVVDYFADTIRELSPKNRKLFVNQINTIVEDAKSCPVAIEHQLSQGYQTYYTPVVRSKTITSDIKRHNCTANYIIDVMRRASDYAKDVADADANIATVKKIFNVQG